MKRRKTQKIDRVEVIAREMAGVMCSVTLVLTLTRALLGSVKELPPVR